MKNNITRNCINLVVTLILLFSFKIFAQIPTVINGAPGSSLGGATFDFDIELTNTGVVPGYSPYIRVILEDGVTLNNVTWLGTGITVKNIGVFPPGPGNVLEDPYSKNMVTGPEGGTFKILIIPISAKLPGDPKIIVSANVTLDPTVPVGDTLEITAQGVFGNGTTATGNPIVGAEDTKTVTTTLAILRKSNNATGGNTPPGPSFPFNYTLTIDVANGKTLNNLVLNDVLPAGIQYVGPVTISGNGVNPVISEPPVLPGGPAGTLNITFDSVLGTTSSSDISVTFPVFATDLLDESGSGTSTQTNNVSLDADEIPIQITANNSVTIKHFTLTKSASPGTVFIGDTATYTLKFKLSEYAIADSLIIDDLLPDGTTWVGHQSLNINGSTVPITPTVTPNAVNGTTAVSYDITTETGNLPPTTVGTLIYTATINTDYINPPSPVLSSDKLINGVDATYHLTGGGSDTESKSATITVSAVTITKTVINPQAEYKAGDPVTYRLSMDITSGNTIDIIFADYFPLPILQASTINTNTDLATNPNISLAPNDNLGLTPTSITIDPATNKLKITWPDVTTDLQNQVIAIDISLNIEDKIFPDGMIFTNFFLASNKNSQANAVTGIDHTPITVRSPKMIITKGISATDNPSATLDPFPIESPVDSDITAGADAGDLVTFVVTAENQGAAPAYTLTLKDQLSADYITPAILSVKNGSGTDLTYTGNLFTTGLILDNSLAKNNGTEGAPYTTDTVIITYTAVINTSVNPKDIITNTASVTWKPSVASPEVYPAEEDSATVTITDPAIAKSKTSIAPGYSGNLIDVSVGEVVTYTVVMTIPEGTMNVVTMFDRTDNGLAFTNDITITPSVGVTTSVAGGFPAVITNAIFANSDRDLTLDFGIVTNTNVDDATTETITITTRCRVVNNAIIVRGVNRNNRARLGWNDSIGTPYTLEKRAANVTVIEPTLNITKTLSAVTGDAGDVITVTLDIAHDVTSDAAAFDVNIKDSIPAGMTFVPASFATAGQVPDAGPTENLGIITATWDSLLKGQTAQITFDVTLDQAVTPTQSIQNTSTIEWESLKDSDQAALPNCPTILDGHERTGNSGDPGGALNNYNGSDNDSIAVDDASVNITVDSVSPNGAAPNITTGDIVKYLITVTLPEGTTPSLTLSNLLPAGLEYVAASATVETTGFAGSVDTTPTISTSGAVATGQTVKITFDSPANTIVTADNNPANNSFKVYIDAVVKDLPANSAKNALQAKNDTVTLDYTGNSGTIQNSVSKNFAEPDLVITKAMSPNTNIDAGDTITITLTVTNNGTAPAYDIVVTDILNDAGDLFDLTTVIEGTTPAGYTYNYANPTVTYTANNATVLQGGGTSAIFTCTAKVNSSIVTGSSYSNTADVTGDSQDGAVTDERATADSGTGSVTTGEVGANIILKATSEAWTATNSVAIGEILTYEASFTIPEGLTREDSAKGIITVDMPTGMQFQVGSALIRAVADTTITGSKLSGLLDPIPAADTAIVPSLTGSTLKFDLGNLQNNDNDPDDEKIVITWKELVLNTADNQLNNGKTNRAYLNYLNKDGGAQSVSDTTIQRIAESNLTITKTALPTTVTGGQEVTCTIVLTNTNATRVTQGWEVVLADDLPGRYKTPTLTSAILSRGSLALNASFVGNLLTVDMTNLPAADRHIDPDDTITVIYTADIDSSISFEEQVTNTVTATCTSLPGNKGTGDVTPGAPGDNDGERTGSLAGTGDNDLTVNDTATVTADKPTVVKTGDKNLQILEKTTMTITMAIPVGTTDNYILTDTLQAGLSYTGTAITITKPANIATTKNPNTSPGAGTNPLVFDFGTVTNSDTVPLNLVIEYEVVVDNVIGNQNGTNLDNTAKLSYQGASVPLPKDTATITVVEPNLSISKTITAGAADSDAGDTISYQVIIANTGVNGTAYRVNLIDVLPSELLGGTPTFDNVLLTNPGSAVVVNSDGVTPLALADASIVTTNNADDTLIWALFDMPPSSSITITYDVIVDNSAVIGQKLTNNVIAGYNSLSAGSGRDDSDSNDDNDANLDNYGQTASRELTLSSAIAIQNTLTAGQPDNKFTIGETVLYDVKIDVKEGTVNNVIVTNVLPTGLNFVELVTIVAGSGKLTYTGTGNAVEGPAGTITVSMGNVTNEADQDDTNDYFIIKLKAIVADHIGNLKGVVRTNSASVTTDSGNAGPDTQDITIIEPQLEILKVANDTTPPLGGTVTYTITVRHTGSNDADAHDILLTDLVPGSLTYVSGSTVGDASVDESTADQPVFSISSITLVDAQKTFSFKVTVDLDATVGQLITNTINGVWTSMPGTPTIERSYNGSGSGGVTPETPAVIDALKTVAIAIDVAGNGVVDPGDTLEYTIVLTNGSKPVENVTFFDPVPNNATYVAASLTSDTGVTDDTGNPDLAVDIGNLAADAVVNITFRVTVDAGTPAGTVILNQGVVDSDQTVPELTDNDGIDANGDQSTDIIDGGAPVVKEPLYVNKFVDWTDDADASGDISPGDTIRYYFVFHDLGNVDLTNVSLADTIPTGLTYTAATKFVSGVGSSIDITGQNATITIPNITSSDFEYAYFDITVDNPLVDFNGGPNDETFTNQGIADSDQTTPVMTDDNLVQSDGNGATIFVATDNASGTAKLDVEKRVQIENDVNGDGLLDPGDTIKYAISINNNGSAPSTDTRLTDTIPANTTLVSGSVSTTQGVVVTEDPVAINIGTLDPGGFVIISFNVKINGGIADGTVISNQANVTADGGINEDSDDNANPADGKNPTLILVDSSSGGGSGAGVPYNLTNTIEATSEADSTGNNVMIGEVVTFRISSSYLPGTSKEINISDSLPTGLTYIPGTARLARVFDTGLNSSINPANINNTASGTFVAISDANDLSISGQVISLFLGDIINSESDPNEEQYILEIKAVAANITGNITGATITNSANLSYHNQLSFPRNLTPVDKDLKIIEPAINIAKSANLDYMTTQGGKIRFTLVVTNPTAANIANAYDLNIKDVLPAGWNSLAFISATPAGGVSGVSNNTAGNTIDIDVTSFPINGTLTVFYDATVNGPLVAGTLSNTANIAWTSLPGAKGTGNATPGNPGDADGERTGSGVGVNDNKKDSNTIDITIADYTMTKSLVSPQIRYSIGDPVSYKVIISIPANATIPNNIYKDILDEGLTYINATLAINYDVGVTSSKNPAAFTRTDDAPIPGQETLLLDFGTLANSTAGALNITITYQAIVDNLLSIQNNSVLKNAGVLTFDNPAGGTSEQITSDLNITVGEPHLTMANTVTSATGGINPGDTIDYQVVIGNNGNRTAFDVIATDTLAAELENITNLIVSGTTGGAETPTLTNNGTDWISSEFDVPVAGTVTITFSADIKSGTPLGTTITNTVAASFASRNGADANQRDGSTPGSNQDDDTDLNNYNNSDDATVKLNQKPTADAQTVTAVEDIEKVITLSGSDPDVGDTLTYKISTLAANGKLYQVLPDNVTRGAEISATGTVITNALHNVIYLSGLNGNGPGYGNFEFTVTDDAPTPVTSDPALVTVNVTPVQDPPAANPQTVEANEDVDEVITLTGSDPDGDSLIFTIVSLPLKGILYQTPDGTTKGAAIAAVPALVTNAQNKVIFLGDLNESGPNYGNFNFNVTDDGVPPMTSPDALVTVNVNPVNDPPTITPIPDQIIPEDTMTAPIPFTVDDLETPADQLIVTGSSSDKTLVPDANIVISGTGANKTVTLTPALNQNGITTISMTVSDGELSATTTFTLTVTPVNNPPVFTSTPVTDATVNLNYTYDITTYDVDNLPAELVISAPILPNWLTITDNGDGTATLHGKPLLDGDYDVTLRVTDPDGLFADQSFIITAVKTEKQSCILWISENPIKSGLTNPTIGRHIVTAGEPFSVSATPTTGNTFTGWTKSGNAEITSPELKETTITLFSDTFLTANFAIKDAGDTLLTMTVNDPSGGTTTPVIGLSSVLLGSINNIIASAAPTYVFIRWDIDGIAAITDKNLASSYLTVNSKTIATAVFVPLADAIVLEVKVAVDGEGLVTTNGSQYVEVGETREITAIPNAGYVFTGWTKTGNVDIENSAISETSITVNGNAVVTANFAKLFCTSSAGKLDIKFSNKKANQDSLKLTQIPLYAKTFNPDTDTIRIVVDGHTFTLNNTNGTFKAFPKNKGFKYKSNDKTISSFRIDFTKGIWNLRARRSDLNKINNLNGVDIIFYINNTAYPMRYDMDEKINWSFNSRKNSSDPITFTDSTVSSFGIERNSGKISNVKIDHDTLSINKAQLDLGTGNVFDPTQDTVGFFMDELTIIIPPNSFENKNNVFKYKNININMVLDFNKNTWTIKLKKLSAWSKTTTMDGVKVFLMIGDAVGSELSVFSKTKLKYKPKKTRYSENIK